MDRTLVVERALSAADPHQLMDVLRSSLADQYGVSRAELRLVDHAMRSLQPVAQVGSASEPVSVDSSPQGRAFGAQEPHVVPDGDALTLHLPVSVRSDRVGVLSLTLPAVFYEPSVLAELERVGTVLGREILVAGRETDQFEVSRRAERLTLAAEIQWLLLPGRSCARDEFSFGAHLEPAYSVFGDSFDWSISSDHLTVVVADGMGQGVDAALLTSLMIGALRNARRAGLGLAHQATLADEAVFAQHRGRAYVAVLLMRVELATGQVEIVDAGSPRMWRLRDHVVAPLSFDEQLPLGMFGDTPYQVERMQLLPGDRLMIASDGLHAAASPAGAAYAERELARTVRATRLLPAAQVPAVVLREAIGYHGGPMADDAVVVCVDWHGRPGGAR